MLTPEKQALLTDYVGLLDQLRAMCETRLLAAQTHGFPRVFSSHVDGEAHLAVLLDQDLHLLTQQRHPAGDKALLEVAHRALLLYSARRAAKAAKAEAELSSGLSHFQAKLDAVQASVAEFAVADGAWEKVPARKTAVMDELLKAVQEVAVADIQAEEDKAVRGTWVKEGMVSGPNEFDAAIEQGIVNARKKRKASQARFRRQRAKAEKALAAAKAAKAAKGSKGKR